MATKTIKMMSGFMAFRREMPDAFIAVSSNRSPRFPNTISEASRMARGRAIGTMVSAA